MEAEQERSKMQGLGTKLVDNDETLLKGSTDVGDFMTKGPEVSQVAF